MKNNIFHTPFAPFAPNARAYNKLQKRNDDLYANLFISYFPYRSCNGRDGDKLSAFPEKIENYRWLALKYLSFRAILELTQSHT